MADFAPKPKERGDVILAGDWNSAMDEIVRVGGDLDTQTLKRTGGTIQGDLNVTGSVTAGGKVGIGTANPSVPLEVNGAVKATSFQGDGSALTDLDAVSKSGGTIAGALTVTAVVSAAGFVGDGSKLTGIDKGPWTAKDGALVYAGGDVGIGLDKPSATLEVNGTIKAAKFVGDGSGLTGIVVPENKWSDSADGIQYKAGAKVTIGAPNSGTSLQIINKNQDPSGDSLVVGRLDGTHLRFGYQAGYGWIQSQTDKPLAINPLGGKVGIGTNDPQAALDVAGGAIAMRQAADPNSASALLDKLPNSSLILGGPSGENLVFFWKDEAGKKYQLSLKGEVLTG